MWPAAVPVAPSIPQAPVWMTQIARNATDVEDSFLRGTRYLF
jgi:hypothetical protein